MIEVSVIPNVLSSEINEVTYVGVGVKGLTAQPHSSRAINGVWVAPAPTNNV